MGTPNNFFSISLFVTPFLMTDVAADCGDYSPTVKPHLFQINTKNTTATIYFTGVIDVNKYLIYYGYAPNSENFNAWYIPTHRTSVLRFDITSCNQACGIRDTFAEFKKHSVVVLGISTDSVKSHKNFEEKYTLPYPLLADVTKQVVSVYGLWEQKKFMGKSYMVTNRTSFLIDPFGNIAQIYEHVKPEEHAAQIIQQLA